MIFKTIEDETTISGQRIVGALQARKIAQQQATVQLETDIACLKKYEIACQSGSVSTEQFDNIMKKASVTAKEYTVNIQNGTGSAQSYAQAQKANNAALQSVGVGANVASKAVKLLSATMNTIAFTAIFSLISRGISWVTEQIDNYIHRNEIAIEKAEELLDTFKSEVDTITSNQDKINGYADEFEELAKGVDDLGRNVSLTADEYSRYQSIVKEIVGINPSLISGYDEENNILADKNGLIETSIQLLKDEYNQRLKNLALPDNIDTAIDGAIGRYNTAKGELQTAIDDIPNRLLSTSFGHIDDKGNVSYGYANFGLADIFADVIGVDFDVMKQSQADYIYENMDAILDNMDAIKERASQTKDGIQGLSETQLIDLMDYLKELRILYTDMNNASSSANSTLQYVAMAEDSYSQLTDIQKKFIADYVNGIQITSETTDQEKENIRKSIISLTQELSDLDDVEVQNAFANLYSSPTDKQTTDVFVKQFRDAYAIIETYCKENGIEIPISIMDSKDEIDELEEKYNAAISKFTGDANDVDLGKFFEDNSINDESEIDYWNRVTEGAKTASKAVEMYNDAKKTDNEITVFSDFFSLEDTEGKATALGNLNDQIDELQKAYTGLKKAMDSYKETGTFTLDQVQEIISYGGEYLKYLMDENGNLQLNEEALNNVAIARINEMRVKALSNLMDNLDSITNEASALEYLKQQLIDTAEGYDEITESRINAWLSNTLESNITDSTRESLLASFRNQANAINEMFDNISIGSISNSSTKDAEKSAKEYVDSYMEFMKSSLETNRIDFKTYSNDVSAFLKKMFDEGKISGKEYFDYVQEQLETEKKVMDAVISAVTYRIDEEIDRLKSEQDEIQNTIDTLREANDEKERALELEKARYELARLQSQRTIKLYTQDKGIIYTNDHTSIRETQEKLKDLEFEEIIKGLEDEKEALNNSIEELEKYKDKWNNIQKQHEINLNKMHANDILGQNWEKDVLSGRIDTLNNFANNYFNIQKAIADAAWNSANEQIKAAEAAQKAQPSIDTVDIKEPKHYNTRYKVVVGGAPIKDFGNSYTAKVWMKNNAPSGTIVPYQVPVYAKGGVIGNNKSPLDSIAQSLGEDHVILAKEGERILTPVQNGMWEKWTDALPNLQNFANMLQYNIPRYDLDNMIIRNNNPATNITFGEIHLHEVQNVPDFAKALQKHLPNISVQYNGKH